MTGTRIASWDQLLALPVSGESFLLRRSHYAVLVDGGWKKDKVRSVLATHFPAIGKLDIVVCTHGDGDHAGGLPDLLNNWPGQIGQVWLPGRWADVVPDLMKDPKGFVKRLLRELDEIIRANKPDPVVSSPFDRFGGADDQTAAETFRTDEDLSIRRDGDDEAPFREEEDRYGAEIDLGATEPIDEPTWFDELRKAVNLPGDEVASRAFESARSSIKYRERKLRLSAGAATGWLGMIDTVEAIRGIANAAIARKLRVRWFDYRAFEATRRPSGGVPGFLEPINAREQAPAPLYASLLLRLTEINRHSLVFFAPPTITRLGVLLCGDSPLGDGSKFATSFLSSTARPRYPIVSTAPHHGAETNSAAYQHMRGWADIIVLVRAGGSSSQPGQTFKSLKWPLKVCATCPATRRAAHIAGVASAGPNWWYPLVIVGKPCACA